MFPGFTPFDIQVSPDIKIHGIRSGTGPPLLLLHGFPQTHHIWHVLAPSLTPNFTVICIDLRGYGASSKPPATPSHSSYAKSAMAADCIAVMSHFSFPKFGVISHDRGARVAHKLCVDYPESVTKVMVLDICPTLSMFEQTNQEFASAYWHWFFLIQPSPFPENAIFAAQELFAERFFGGGYAGDSAKEEGFWNQEALGMYRRQLGDREGLVGMCEDYRAAASVDLVESRRDREEGKKVKCDLRVLWGKTGVVEKCFDALREWRAVCEGEVSGESVDSGHYIAEEQPDVLLKHVREFFS
jgi:haloacetate dehalogenase